MLRAAEKQDEGPGAGPLLRAMFKFAFILGIAIEWLLGPSVHAVEALGFAALRSFMFMLLAWTLLEATRLLVRAVLSLEDRAS